MLNCSVLKLYLTVVALCILYRLANRQAGAISMSFLPRATFPFPHRTPSWFAGHMARSLRDLPSLLEDIDLVIEARDARLPLTSVNGAFDSVLEKVWGYLKEDKLRSMEGGHGKEKIVVYTKRDLAEQKYEEVGLASA
jgi:hypothetical protein